MSKKTTPQKAPIAEAGMKRHNVFMPQALLDGLDEVAHSRGGKSAEHLRKAVAAYLRRLGVSV